jgi:hypothetical protein
MGCAELKKETKEINIAVSHTFGPTIEGNHWSFFFERRRFLFGSGTCLGMRLERLRLASRKVEYILLAALVCVHYIACIQWVESQ